MEATSTVKRDMERQEDLDHEQQESRRRLIDAEWERLMDWPPYMRDYEGYRPEGV